MSYSGDSSGTGSKGLSARIRIGLFDPGISEHTGTPSTNLGNLIIQQSVERELARMFPGCDVVRISTFQAPTFRMLAELQKCDWVIVGGTNILTSEMNQYRQWVLSLWQAILIRRAILLGAGWWKYQDPPNTFTRFFLRQVLSERHLHSVRDGYTAGMLAKAGYNNVVNTGCPTMWMLAEATPDEFPTAKAGNALVMLTDYDRNPVADQAMLDLVADAYEKVWFWPQGQEDLDYLKTLRTNAIIIDRSLGALNTLLRDEPSLDYIGTRLHGGIHCLNQRRRALVLIIDNRTREIAKDTGLAACERTDTEAIRRWIWNAAPTRIRIDTQAIDRWRSQFGNAQQT